MSEIWRPIPGYEELYEVSNLGRVRRCPKVMALADDGRGRYPRVRLFKDQDGRFHRVHQLVAAAFIGEKPRGHEINHKNGNSTDNRPENLEYCTKSENIRHSIHVLGNPTPPSGANHNSKTSPETFPRGVKHGNAKLNDAKVRAIRKAYQSGEVSQPDLAREYGVSLKAIWMIVNGVTWKHV